MENIGENIKKRRTELNMSQDELAKRIGYTSRSAINKIEKGVNNVKQTTILRLAEALHTTPSYLMGWTDNPEPYKDFELRVAQPTIQERLAESNISDDDADIMFKYLKFDETDREIVKGLVERLSLKYES